MIRMQLPPSSVEVAIDFRTSHSWAKTKAVSHVMATSAGWAIYMATQVMATTRSHSNRCYSSNSTTSATLSKISAASTKHRMPLLRIWTCTKDLKGWRSSKTSSSRRISKTSQSSMRQAVHQQATVTTDLVAPARISQKRTRWTWMNSPSTSASKARA